MYTYVDCFCYPLAKRHVETYKKVAVQVAQIWKEHGALSYVEYLGDDLKHPGLRSFADLLNVQSGEVVVFGQATFPSLEIRNAANAQVRKDARMAPLVTPLMEGEAPIFDPARMFYGGFVGFVDSEK